MHIKLFRNRLKMINPDVTDETIMFLAKQAEDIYFTVIQPLFGSLLADQKQDFIFLAISKQLLKAYHLGWEDRLAGSTKQINTFCNKTNRQIMNKLERYQNGNS